MELTNFSFRIDRTMFLDSFYTRIQVPFVQGEKDLRKECPFPLDQVHAVWAPTWFVRVWQELTQSTQFFGAELIDHAMLTPQGPDELVFFYREFVSPAAKGPLQPTKTQSVDPPGFAQRKRDL